VPDLDPFDGQDHSNDVVVYRAVVRFEVEAATLWFRPDFAPEDIRVMLERPAPHYIRPPWPPPLTGNADADLRLLALLRLRAGLALGSRLASRSTAEEIRTAIMSREELRPESHVSDAGDYATYRITVAIDVGGEHSFVLAGYQSRGKPLPVEKSTIKTSQSPLNKHLLALVQVDLLRRAEELRTEYRGR